MKKKYFIAVLCLVLSFVLVGIAFGASKILWIPEQKQQYEETCWASVGSMISAYFKGNNNNYEDEIFWWCKPEGTDPNSYEARGNVYDTEKGVKHITGKPGSCQLNPLSYTAVKYQTNAGGPIGAGVKYYFGYFGGGHMLALRGYNDDSAQNVYYVDPKVGAGYRCSYNYFKDTLGWINSVFWK